MGNELKAVVRCEICQLDSVGSTLGEALKGLCCKTEESGVSDFHKPFLTVDGKAVYQTKRKIPDEYKGETNLTGISTIPQPEVPKVEPPKEEKPAPDQEKVDTEPTKESTPKPDKPIAEQDSELPERKPGK